VLEGWYTNKTPTAQKVLNPDGKVAGDVAGYTQGGLIVADSDLEVYARWRKDNVYAVVDKLWDINDNGEYLIVNSSTVTTGQAMQVTPTGTDVLGYDVGIHAVTNVYREGGNATGAYIESPVEAADIEAFRAIRWNINYLTLPSEEKYAPDVGVAGLYPVFSIQSVLKAEANKDSFIRENSGNLEFRTNTTLSGNKNYYSYYGHNNKHVWTYGVIDDDHCLRTAFRVDPYRLKNDNGTGGNGLYNEGYKENTKYSVYWNGTKWVGNSNDKTCALFKKTTIYSYEAE
jgi:hypothetical protein